MISSKVLDHMYVHIFEISRNFYLRLFKVEIVVDIRHYFKVLEIDIHTKIIIWKLLQICINIIINFIHLFTHLRFCVFMTSIKSNFFQIFTIIEKSLTHETMFVVFHVRNKYLFLIICHEINDYQKTISNVFIRIQYFQFIDVILFQRCVVDSKSMYWIINYLNVDCLRCNMTFTTWW